jgi:hypothetical protein
VNACMFGGEGGVELWDSLFLWQLVSHKLCVDKAILCSLERNTITKGQC